MTGKFKIGDIVELVDECKSASWYHNRTMKIIAFNEFYYFTDYWHAGDLKKHGIEYFKDNLWDGITEECLDYPKEYYREQKLKRILE